MCEEKERRMRGKRAANFIGAVVEGEQAKESYVLSN